METVNFLPEYLPKIKEIDKECFLKREDYAESYLLFLWQKFPQGFLVVKEGNEVLGYGICQKETKEEGIIFSIAVKKKWQNLGIGSHILKQLIEVLEKEKVKKIILHVREDNKGAISLYKNFGFEIKKRIERYYSNGEPAYLMEKNIE